MKGTQRVVDFAKAKKEKIEERRREYERILFKNVLGVYSVAEGEGMNAIELIDFSKTGCSFQIPKSKEAPTYKVGEQTVLRLYFSQKTYLPIKVSIKNMTDCIEDGVAYVRYGCRLNPKEKTYEALRPFIEFIYKYAEHAKEDEGDVKVLFFI